MWNSVEEIVDKLFEYQGIANTPGVRRDQIALAESLIASLGKKRFDQLFKTWLGETEGKQLTFEDFQRDKRVRDKSQPTSKHANLVEEQKYLQRYRRENGIIPVHLEKVGVKASDVPSTTNLWDTIYKPIDKIPTDNVFLNEDLFEMLIQQMPYYSAPPHVHPLQYMASNFNIPMVVGIDDYYIGLKFLEDIHKKVHMLTSMCVLSPHEIDRRLCPMGFWEEFPSGPLDSDQRELLSRERMVVSGPRVGLFAIQLSDDTENYDKEFRQLLRHFVTQHRAIILISKEHNLRTGHWLIPLLKSAITVDLEDLNPKRVV